MARSFSEDLRGRLLQAVDEGVAARAAGGRFAIAPTTAIRWARVWRARHVPPPACAWTAWARRWSRTAR